MANTPDPPETTPQQHQLESRAKTVEMRVAVAALILALATAGGSLAGWSLAWFVESKTAHVSAIRSVTYQSRMDDYKHLAAAIHDLSELPYGVERGYAGPALSARAAAFGLLPGLRLALDANEKKIAAGVNRNIRDSVPTPAVLDEGYLLQLKLEEFLEESQRLEQSNPRHGPDEATVRHDVRARAFWLLLFMRDKVFDDL